MELSQLSGRGYLDESASFEESCEQILYYFDNRLEYAAENASEKQDPFLYHPRIPEAVQFVGVCTALYSLPTSMDPEQETSKDNSEFVYLKKSLLVFVTLELCPLVVAIVQVARTQNNDDDEMVECVGSPLAIKLSIQKSYHMFQLLRGGGIHHRLKNSIDASSVEDPSENVYPGMGRLYELRKRVRKARDQNKIRDAESQISDQEIRDIERNIEDLELKLPITSLRADLSVHFNDLMEELTVIGRWRGVKRCLVDALPTPLSLMFESHRKSSSQPRLSSELFNRLLGSIQDIMNHHWAPGDPFLLGITTFWANQLISTIYTPSESSKQMHCRSCFEVSPKSAHLIMQYVASYRYKIMIHHHANHSAATTPPRFHIQRLQLPFESTDGPSGDDPESVVGDDVSQTRLGQFFSPPPLSMLSATDSVHDVHGPKGERIWTPRFYLPQGDQGNPARPDTFIEVHALVYEVNDFCFLLHFAPDAVFSQGSCANGNISPPAIPPVQQNFSNKLETISRKLTEGVDYLVSDRKPEASNSLPADSVVHFPPFTTSSLDWKESGQDTIFVDRTSNQIIVFSDRLADASAKRTQISPSRSPSRGFLSRLKSRKSQRPSARARKAASAPNGQATGLDCLHILASMITSEALNALDDVITEVQERRKQISGNDVCFWEVVTFSAHGWIYARTHGQKEIYILFDSSLYATLADVQNAASRIREELLMDVV